jgi:hypothetical protein
MINFAGGPDFLITPLSLLIHLGYADCQ